MYNKIMFGQIVASNPSDDVTAEQPVTQPTIASNDPNTVEAEGYEYTKIDNNYIYVLLFLPVTYYQKILDFINDPDFNVTTKYNYDDNIFHILFYFCKKLYKYQENTENSTIVLGKLKEYFDLLITKDRFDVSLITESKNKGNNTPMDILNNYCYETQNFINNNSYFADNIYIRDTREDLKNNAKFIFVGIKTQKKQPVYTTFINYIKRKQSLNLLSKLNSSVRQYNLFSKTHNIYNINLFKSKAEQFLVYVKSKIKEKFQVTISGGGKTRSIRRVGRGLRPRGGEATRSRKHQKQIGKSKSNKRLPLLHKNKTAKTKTKL